jgi:Do/DeqQ family serine protease
MKQLVKSMVNTALVAVVSVGVTLATVAYMQKAPQQQTQNVKSFQETFQTDAQVSTASFAGNSMQPIDLRAAANKAVHAVVHITSKQNSKIRTIERQPDIFDFFFGDGQGRRQQVRTQPRVGFGSGVIISKDGYIVTNNHVIANSDEIDVTLNDNRHFKARLIGTDPNTDLALIKIEGEDFPTLTVGDSEKAQVGEWVLAVGNPFNLTSTVTAGIVSAKARTLGVYNGGIESFIQTDAAINKGNSGGALVNAKGELIGINAVLSSPTGAYAGYGFAIPTSIMTKVIADLRQYGTVQRALLGITGHDIDEKTAEKDLGTVEGVYVVEVNDESSAAEAGIQKGDVIVALNGHKVKNMAELQENMTKYRPGNKVSISIMRDKKKQKLHLTLKNAQGTTKVIKGVDITMLGGAFRPLPKKLKAQLNLRYGLQVTGVNKGKMRNAGLRKGFIILKVNGKRMAQTGDLEMMLKEAARSPEQVLFISGMYPSGKRANYAVDLSDN